MCSDALGWGRVIDLPSPNLPLFPLPLLSWQCVAYLCSSKLAFRFLLLIEFSILWHGLCISASFSWTTHSTYVAQYTSCSCLSQDIANCCTDDTQCVFNAFNRFSCFLQIQNGLPFFHRQLSSVHVDLSFLTIQKWHSKFEPQLDYSKPHSCDNNQFELEAVIHFINQFKGFSWFLNFFLTSLQKNTHTNQSAAWNSYKCKRKLLLSCVIFLSNYCPSAPEDYCAHH